MRARASSSTAVSAAYSTEPPGINPRAPPSLERSFVTCPIATSLGLDGTGRGRPLVVILIPEVGDELFAAHVAHGVLELHELDEEVVLGVEAGGGHGALEVEGEPFLDAGHAAALGEV